MTTDDKPETDRDETRPEDAAQTDDPRADAAKPGLSAVKATILMDDEAEPSVEPATAKKTAGSVTAFSPPGQTLPMGEEPTDEQAEDEGPTVEPPTVKKARTDQEEVSSTAPTIPNDEPDDGPGPAPAPGQTMVADPSEVAPTLISEPDEPEALPVEAKVQVGSTEPPTPSYRPSELGGRRGARGALIAAGAVLAALVALLLWTKMDRQESDDEVIIDLGGKGGDAASRADAEPQGAQPPEPPSSEPTAPEPSATEPATPSQPSSQPSTAPSSSSSSSQRGFPGLPTVLPTTLPSVLPSSLPWADSPQPGSGEQAAAPASSASSDPGASGDAGS